MHGANLQVCITTSSEIIVLKVRTIIIQLLDYGYPIPDCTVTFTNGSTVQSKEQEQVNPGLDFKGGA